MDTNNPSQRPPVLDPESIKNLVSEFGDDFVVELIEIFFETAPGLINDLRTGHGSENWPAVQRAAHTLKSNAATLGATKLASLCKDVEAHTQAGAPTEIQSSIAEVLEEFPRVTRELGEKVSKGQK